MPKNQTCITCSAVQMVTAALRMQDRRIFQLLHRQFSEIGSFRLIRHEAGRRKAVRVQA